MIEQNKDEKEPFSDKEIQSEEICDNDSSNLYWKLKDLGRLKKPVVEVLIQKLVKQGLQDFQHSNGPLVADGQGRSLSMQRLVKRSANGEAVPRTWLLYSPFHGCCYCFPCFLFAMESDSQKSSFAKEDGFRNWRKLNQRIPDHENSPVHRNYMIKYLDNNGC